MLTALGVQKIAPRERTFEVPDGKVRGLWLVIQPSGAKSWCVRFSRHNRDRRFTIGRYPVLGLDAARKAAGEALARVAAGRDPIEERKEQRRKEERERAEAVTVQAVYESRYEPEHVATLGEGTAANVRRMFTRYILPAIGKAKIGEVSTDACAAIWEKEAKRGYASNAHKVFAVLRHFFGWLRRKRIMTKANPVEDMEPPKEGAPRERVLNTAELRLVWLAAGETPYPFGAFVQLLILTLARRNEVSEMMKRELDLAAALWTLPSARTKNSKEHLVPLSGAAMDILRRIHNYVGSTAGWVFTTDGETSASNFSKRKRVLDAIVTRLNGGEAIPNWTLHDLRRTGDTGMHELGVAPHIVEACVNHVGHKSGVRGTYNRAQYLPEKRDAFERWAAHVLSVADGRAV